MNKHRIVLLVGYLLIALFNTYYSVGTSIIRMPKALVIWIIVIVSIVVPWFVFYGVLRMRKWSFWANIVVGLMSILSFYYKFTINTSELALFFLGVYTLAFRRRIYKQV